MNAHPTESELIDLATGLLEPADAPTTMEHIRGCAECERRFRSIVADHEALRGGPIPTVVDGRVDLAPPRRRARLRDAVIAAALVAAIALGTFRVVEHRDRMPEYWIPVIGETNVLRGTEQRGVADALRSYRDRDAATAIKDLQELQPPAGDNTSSTLRDLYLASALINAGRANEGLEILDRNDIQSMPTPWRYEAEWVKYIGLRRADRDDEARAWLEKLSTEPGPNSARVQAELKRRND